MGRIVVSENITVDGVVADPTGEDGTAFGGWFTGIGDADRAAWTEAEFAEARGAAALLMGRGTYAYFAPRWVDREGGWADRLRALPKYVVSTTLTEPQWANTTVLSGDAVDEAAKLRDAVEGEIVVNGSSGLVRTLLSQGLVDELRLMTFPFVAGAGASLFTGLELRRPLRLVGLRPVGDGLALLSYRPDAD